MYIYGSFTQVHSINILVFALMLVIETGDQVYQMNVHRLILNYLLMYNLFVLMLSIMIVSVIIVLFSCSIIVFIVLA